MTRGGIPLRTSSRIYLLQKLDHFGVPALPEAAVQDLADEAIRLCQSVGRLRRQPWRPDVTDYLDGKAASVAYLLMDDRDAAGRQLISGEQRDGLTAMLTKHGVQVPPVDTLRGH